MCIGVGGREIQIIPTIAYAHTEAPGHDPSCARGTPLRGSIGYWQKSKSSSSHPSFAGSGAWVPQIWACGASFALSGPQEMFSGHLACLSSGMRPKARAAIKEQNKLQLFCCLSCTLGANLSFPRVIPNSNYLRESQLQGKGGRIQRPGMERLVARRFKLRSSMVELSI